MGHVSDILEGKSNRVVCIRPSANVLQATELMNAHRIGALVVTNGSRDLDHSPSCNRVAGIFTERDVLTRVVGMQKDPATTAISDVMTTDVAFCRPDAEIEEVAAIMQKHRIRHLPVCDADGELVGLISIGDVNAFHARGLDTEIHYLHDYIYGRV
jgi:CBS domain-containing protein